MQFINIADMKAPNDPRGRSYREVNLAKTHAIPIGTLVEIESGARAFVVSHDRDCDGTPLYSISLDREDTAPMREGFGNPGWSNGYPEYGLKVVAP